MKKAAARYSILLLSLAGLAFFSGCTTQDGPRSSSSNITGMFYVNINCSDYEMSRAFYEKLGFRVTMEIPQNSTPETAAAMGMTSFQVRGATMAIGRGVNVSFIDLMEWKDPRDDEAPYEKLNHLGIVRLALITKDLDADIAMLKEEEVEFISEPASFEVSAGPAVRFVLFKDPDGTLIELLEMPKSNTGA